MYWSVPDRTPVARLLMVLTSSMMEFKAATEVGKLWRNHMWSGAIPVHNNFTPEKCLINCVGPVHLPSG